ncbi:MAG: RloB family protein [Sphaerochaetaceae bacterium]|nr:RloB family protein [Sphaerochaetaceae bacterium]
MIIISTEGTVTEQEYFNIFNSENTVLHVKVLKDMASDPNNVLRRMKRYLDENPLQDKDQAWLVIDKDRWTDNQIRPLYDWSRSLPKYGFALSNPKFELWLLVHFEDAKGIKSSRNCSERLERYLPGYNKKVEPLKISPYIQDAVDRAEKRDRPPCTDWPRTTGTTVYRLVKELLKDAADS